MSPSSLNSTPNSISIKNSVIGGMSLGTLIDIRDLSATKSDRMGVELVTQVSHWLTDSMLIDAPIIQSPYDYTKEHPVLKQPASIDHDFCNKITSLIKKREKKQIFRRSISILETHLQNDSERKTYESENFGVSIIQEEHLRALPKAKRKNHSTLGVRGAIANKDIKAGSPLVYSAQYITDEEWDSAASVLTDYLSQELNAPSEDASADAERRLCCYAFDPVEFQSQLYNVSAYGAGNVCAMINHDNEFSNMKIIRPHVLDNDGKPAADVTFYFAVRDIKKGEQLLVDYGAAYEFHEFLDCRKTIYF